MFAQRTVGTRNDGTRLRVALVHYWLTNMRGGERVLESLCRLFPQADIYTHVVNENVLSGELRKHQIYTTFIQKLPMAARFYKYYLPLMPFALEQLDLRGYDLVISIESGPAKGIVPHTDTFHLCYCCSPMRYLYDFYQDYIESANFFTRFIMKGVFHRLRQWDYVSAQHVDRIVADSSAVARRVKRWWRRDAAVIHPPVNIELFMRDADLSLLQQVPGSPVPGGYYLCFGELVDYKRIDLAVRVCSSTGRRLLVAGNGPCRKTLERMAGPEVCFIGRVSDELLPALFAGCRAFLFPGEEDFGIAPLEAAAAGAFVIAYGKGGILDSFQNGEGALFFDDQTEQSLCSALDRFEKLTAAERSPKPREALSMFSEKFFHEKILSSLNDD